MAWRKTKILQIMPAPVGFHAEYEKPTSNSSCRLVRRNIIAIALIEVIFEADEDKEVCQDVEPLILADGEPCLARDAKGDGYEYRGMAQTF